MPTPRPFAAVPRIERPTRAVFDREFVRPARPVVITGALASWPAMQRWSPAYFREHFGDAIVPTYVIPGGRVQLDRDTGFRLESMTMRAYAEYAVDGGPVQHYLRAGLAAALPAVMHDVSAPEYCRDGLRLRSNLWFAKMGTISGLHFDLPNNLFAQVFGHKLFILFAPRESRRLYPHSWISSVPHMSRVDPERPDYARYPASIEAHGQSVSLAPGDLLYIPPRWWHYARSIDVSISANFWWSSPWSYPLSVASDLYKRIRGLNI